MNQGIYEELITQLVSRKINNLNRDVFYINTTSIDKAEASKLLAQHLYRTVKNALSLIKSERQIEEQIHIANKIILLLKEELNNEDFDDDLITVEGEILNAVFSKTDSHFVDL